MLRRYLIRLGIKLLVEEWNAHQFKNASYYDLEQFGIADILSNNSTFEPMFVFDGTISRRDLANKPEKEGFYNGTGQSS